MKLNWKVVLGLAVLAIVCFGTVSFAGPAIPGGGEIGSALSSVTVEDSTWNIYGQHHWPSDDRSDLDGDFEDVDWKVGMDFDSVMKPGITLESNHPYYLEEVASGIYQESEEGVVSKFYELNYTLDGEIYAYRYSLIPYGVDVTIKTDADKFYVDPNIFSYFGWFYGWYYESTPVDVNLLTNFGLAPWVPAGVWNGSYAIVDGWAGIIQAEVYDVEFGVLENEQLEQDMDDLPDGAYYETGYTIQDLNSINSALNMYEPDTGDSYQAIDFENPSALKGVTNAVNIELGAKLGAGAVYTADFLGHTNGLAVRNVYVTYRIVVSLVTTINMKLIAEGSPIVTPGEGNKLPDPPPVPIVTPLATAWNEFWADVGEWLASPTGMFYSILIVAVIIVVGYLVLRIVVRRAG